MVTRSPLRKRGEKDDHNKLTPEGRGITGSWDKQGKEKNPGRRASLCCIKKAKGHPENFSYKIEL